MTPRTACLRRLPEKDDAHCGQPVRYILYDKFFPAEALGPRCENCAHDQLDPMYPGWYRRIDQYAIYVIPPASLDRDDGERLGGIASIIESGPRSLDVDGRHIRYLRGLARQALGGSETLEVREAGQAPGKGREVATGRPADAEPDDAIWVCEKGHVDDRHHADDTINPQHLCSRCGGRCTSHRGIDALARELIKAQAAARASDDQAARAITEPPYPADLLDELAKALSRAVMSALPSVAGLQPFDLEKRMGAREALDRYTQEVGRENVPAEVNMAIGELGG